MRIFVSMMALCFAMSGFAQSVWFENLKNGQIQATGKAFKGSQSSYQVNFYKGSKFLKTINTNRGGTFSYTSPSKTFKNNDKMVVRVLNFYGSGKHFEKSWTYKGVSPGNGSIWFENLKNGQIQATGKKFTGEQSSYQVNFYKGRDFLKSINTSNGSFSYTSPSKTFKNNDKMFVKVLNFYGSGKHFEKSWTYKGSYSDISDEKIRNYANQQARTVANRVANTYGLRENFKYNFVKGFWSGYQEFLRFADPGEPGYGFYRRGYLVGLSEGGLAGARAGKIDAKNNADKKGLVDANERFLAAVDKGEPDTTVIIPNLDSYNGANLRPDVPSVYDHLDDLQGDFSRRLREYYWEYDGFRLIDFEIRWKLRFVYDSSGKYKFLDTYFRGEYAYGEWRNNRLGGKYDYNIYNKLDADQKRFFIRNFKNIYDRVIDEKFYRVRNRPNRKAFIFGEGYGFQTGKKVVRDRGYQDGYQKSSNESSIIIYKESFPGFYTDAFNKRVDYLAANPALILNDIVFVGEVFPSGTMELVVRNIVNYGGVNFKGAPSLRGSGVTQTSSKAIELDRLSSNQGQEIKSGNILKINSDVSVGSGGAISVKLGGTTKNVSFKVSWNNVLKNASLNSSLSDSQKETLKNYIFNTIKAEWDSQRGTSRNDYKDGKNSLLHQIVSFVNANPEARGYFRSLSSKIDKIPPSKVASIKFTLKARKKAFKKLVKKLQ